MKRSPRELEIPDDLWAPLGGLAERLGIERNALVRQAIHAFLRFHGALPDGPVTTRAGARVAAARRVLTPPASWSGPSRPPARPARCG